MKYMARSGVISTIKAGTARKREDLEAAIEQNETIIIN